MILSINFSKKFLNLVCRRNDSHGHLRHFEYLNEFFDVSASVYQIISHKLTSKMGTEKETSPMTMTTENDDRVLDSDSDKIPATLVPSSDVTSKCGLCHRGHISHPLAAGKLYRISGSLTHVHYFCMLFSAYAKQIGGKRLVFNHKCHSLDETIHLPQ